MEEERAGKGPVARVAGAGVICMYQWGRKRKPKVGGKFLGCITPLGPRAQGGRGGWARCDAFASGTSVFTVS